MLSFLGILESRESVNTTWLNLVKPLVKSKQITPNQLSSSLVLGTGYVSNLDTSLSLLKPTWNWTNLSALVTKTTGLLQSLWDSSITPKLIIALSSIHTTFFLCEGKLKWQVHTTTPGGVLLWCSVRFVWPGKGRKAFGKFPLQPVLTGILKDGLHNEPSF